MATAGKKKMRAELKVEPWAEMDSKTSAWAKRVPMFKKNFKDIVFSQDIELDSRKWDAKKLSKALYVLVRYELKIFAVQGSDWCKKVAKGGMKAEIEAVSTYPKAYKKLCKDIDNKCAIALDELAADKGDNKKPLKHCNDAFDTLASIKPRAIIAIPTDETVAAFKKLAKDLDGAQGDSRTEERAFKLAANSLEKANAGFHNSGGDAADGLTMLLKAADTIKKTKEANPVLAEFGKQIEKHAGAMKKLRDDIEIFSVRIADAEADIKSRKLDGADALRKAAFFANNRQLGSKVESTLAQVAKLRTSFNKIDKDLK